MTAAARTRLRFATAAYTTAVAVVSLLPSASGPLKQWDANVAPSVQNLLHVPAYAVLAVLLTLAGPPRLQGFLRQAAIALAACAALGALLELAQAAIPGRSGSLADELRNLTGAGIGVLLVAGGRALAGKSACPGKEMP